MSGEDVYKITEMFKQGYTDEEIAETIHYSVITVRDTRRKLGLLRRRHDLTAEERLEIGRLYRHVPAKKIAERFGCSLVIVRQWGRAYRREQASKDKK